MGVFSVPYSKKYSLNVWIHSGLYNLIYDNSLLFSFSSFRHIKLSEKVSANLNFYLKVWNKYYNKFITTTYIFINKFN